MSWNKRYKLGSVRKIQRCARFSMVLQFWWYISMNDVNKDFTRCTPLSRFVFELLGGAPQKFVELLQKNELWIQTQLPFFLVISFNNIFFKVKSVLRNRSVFSTRKVLNFWDDMERHMVAKPSKGSLCLPFLSVCSRYYIVSATDLEI